VKFPESTASELFPALVKLERFRESYQERGLRFQASGSRFQGSEKRFPAVRSRAELFLESEWIPECWFPVR
jgi:hypothetical protein